MANYRDYALTAYQQREQAQEQAEATDRQQLVDAARQAAAPLLTDATDKLVVGVDKLNPVEVSTDARMVIFTTTDGSDVSFAIYPEKAPVERYVVAKVDDAWQRVAAVRDLDDVGAALAGDV